jgi:PAS domain S-box-containing protein
VHNEGRTAGGWYDDRVTPTERDATRVAGHKAAVGDEERLLRRAIEQAAAQWRTTFDAIGSPILNLTPDGRINRLNRAARDLTGRGYSELIGRQVTDVGGGTLFETAARLVAAIGAERSTASTQVEDRRRGITWDVTAHVREATDETGDERVIVVVAGDISALVELQGSLRQSETLSALGSLVAGVAHQVRNPLFGLSAAIDAFEARFGTNESTVRYISALRDPLARLTQLFQELLEYGKPGKAEAERTDLRSIVSGALRSCRPIAEQKGVVLRWTPPAAEAPVDVDPARLLEAIVNLVENAVQYSDGGEVEVTLEHDEEGNQERPWLCCRVRDHGPGFAEGDLPRLGEPFFSRRHGGIGLGLALVKRVVVENGGRLRLANSTGGGALVEILLPSSTDATKGP